MKTVVNISHELVSFSYLPVRPWGQHYSKPDFTNAFYDRPLYLRGPGEQEKKAILPHTIFNF